MAMLFLLVLTMAAPVQDVPDLHEMMRDPFAHGFSVEHERWERRGMPIMHSPSAWQKVRLRWTSSDGRWSFYYEDDGQVLSLGSALKPAVLGNTCSSFGGAYAFGDVASAASRWRSSYSTTVRLVDGCPHAGKATMARYRAEFDAAAVGFPAANTQFRAVATRVFGQITRRCIAFQSAPKIIIPFWQPECTRWSTSVEGGTKRS